MSKYMEKLLNQFRCSRGIKTEDFDPDLYGDEFYKWLLEYIRIGKFYYGWLKEKGILDELSYDIAEIGKGEYDTITFNQKTTLISPYIRIFEHLDIENKIFNYDFTVFDGHPLYIGRKQFDVVSDIDVFITQNPYCMKDITNWPQLYNYGNRDIVVGIYGNCFDKDKSYKLRQLKIMRERIDDDFKIDEVTNGDTYCYALSTGFTKKKQKLRNQNKF